MMDKTLEIIGSVVGVIGILICLVAGINRMTGGHYLFGYETVTLFTGGIGLMVMGCLTKLQAITLNLNQRS